MTERLQVKTVTEKLIPQQIPIFIEKPPGLVPEETKILFELAEKYKKEGMSAYSKIQQQELDREKDGYTSVKHQREVGTSYFDAVSNTISDGTSSTTAMKGSTESEQF